MIVLIKVGDKVIVKTDYIELEYSEKDVEYIEELITYINYNSQEIIDFFGITNFGEKVSIKLFDNLKHFRVACGEIRTNKEIPLWLCGLSFYKNNKCIIFTLCLDEYKKTDGHNNDTLKQLKLLIMHEFVHACHQKFTSNTRLPKWMSEGLATTISHQYDNIEMYFDATLEQVINGETNFINYHTMFSYVLNKYGRNYILELLKNKEYLEKETPKLYEEVKLCYKQKIK